jgi:acetyltransferase-like isoleucine patch superfamily enzyme
VGEQVGSYAFIGAGATILPDITIGREVIVGAGAVVTRNLLKIGTYAGVPARLLKSAS